MTRVAFATAFFTLIVTAGGLARAQDGPPTDITFSVQRFQTAPGADNFLTIDGARVGKHLSFTVGFMDVFQYKPLVIFDYEDGELAAERAAIVEFHDSLEVFATLSIFEWVQFGIVLPFTLYQKGEGLDPETASSGDGLEKAGGLMDPRIAFKVRFLGRSGEDGFGLALAPWVSIPVGGYGPWKESFQGEKLPTVHARLVADYVWGGLHAAVNVGYFWREPHQLYSTWMEDELTYGGAISYRVHENVTLMGEIFGSVALTTCKDRGDECKSKGIFTDNNAGMPLEAGGGLRLHVWQFDINVGGFGGIIPAVGTPMFRVFLGLNWVPKKEDAGEEAPRTDRDLDGIENKEDSCPDEPEDYDGFEDRDGCPEDDNDQDGVKDGYDSCPLEPEDVDKFEDEDGCPDLDHDKDGVGEDNDECPEDPEDIDGFEDEDGCPEPDNDKDKISDEDDLCPDDPEDYDGNEDEDGCPELDDDGDGIPDVDDKCPNKAEVFNGFQDDDGCPDKGKTLVVITKEQIEIKQKVEFATDSDEIVGDKSFQILDVVAHILKTNPEFKVEVQGHTDNKGTYDHNMDLSQRRAESVVKYLVEKGVNPGNLVAKGYGPDVPIASNKKKKGRAKNRRVEFHILSEEQMMEMSGSEEEPAGDEASGEEGGEEEGGEADMKFDYPED